MKPEDLYRAVTERAYLDPPLAPEKLGALELGLGRRLPDDLRFLLLRHDGYSSAIGAFPLGIWGSRLLLELQDAYKFTTYLPGVLAIGSDGGGKALVYDYRATETDPPLCAVGFGDLAFESLVPIAPRLTDFVQLLLDHQGAVDLYVPGGIPDDGL